MFVSFSALRSVTGLSNRDRVGPRQIALGGVPRSYYSSQSRRRAMRWHPEFRRRFADLPGRLAVRTRQLPMLIAASLPSDISDEERRAVLAAAARLGTVERREQDALAPGAGGDEGESEHDDVSVPADREMPVTNQLMFFTEPEAAELARRFVKVLGDRGLIAFQNTGQREMLKLLGDVAIPPGADVALFGRMTTSSPLPDMPSALAVAPGYGVNRLEQRFDFFTAVDDIAGKTAYLDPGAGTPFTDAVYYEFAALDYGQLLTSLNGDTRLALISLEALVRALTLAVPNGMATRFAHWTAPDILIVEVMVDDQQPLNHLPAFHSPVRATSTQPLMSAAREALLTYMSQTGHMVGIQTARAYIHHEPLPNGRLRQTDHRPTDDVVPDATYCASINQLSDWLTRQVQEHGGR